MTKNDDIVRKPKSINEIEHKYDLGDTVFLPFKVMAVQFVQGQQYEYAEYLLRGDGGFISPVLTKTTMIMRDGEIELVAEAADDEK